jgi:hypothetical protein
LSALVSAALVSAALVSAALVSAALVLPAVVSAALVSAAVVSAARTSARVSPGPDVKRIRHHPVNRPLHEIPVIEHEIRMNSQHPNTEPFTADVAPAVRLERLQVIRGAVGLNRNAILDDIVEMSGPWNELLHANPIPRPA